MSNKSRKNTSKSVNKGVLSLLTIKDYLQFFIGVISIVVSVYMMWNNESANLELEEAIVSGEGVLFAAPTTRIIDENEGKLVYTNGNMESHLDISDEQVGINVKAFGLTRKVKYYNWVERFDLQGSPYYEKAWSDKPVDSSKFVNPYRHENPNVTFFANKQWRHLEGGLGVYKIDPDSFKSFLKEKPLNINQSTLNPDLRKATVEKNIIYIGKDMQRPHIGDMHIEYYYTPGVTLSVVGKQMGNQIGIFTTRDGEKIFRVVEGNVPAGDLYNGLASKTEEDYWKIRGLIASIMVIGFFNLFILAGNYKEVNKKMVKYSGWNAVFKSIGMSALFSGLLFGYIWYGMKADMAQDVMISGGGIFLLLYVLSFLYTKYVLAHK